MARSERAQPTYSLDRYRRRWGIPPWAFNGVENPAETMRGCEHIWTQWQRDDLAIALADAEESLAGEIGYYLGERYIIDYDRVWSDPLQLRYGEVVGAGVRARTEVTPSAFDFTIDPATITVPAASFTNGTSEVVVIEDETGLEIEPYEIETSGTDYIIYLSQYNLIEWADLEDQSDSIDYDATFPAATWLKLADLTVYREYRDTDTQATITYGPSCNCWCADGACDGTDYTGCVFVTNRRIGLVRVNRATLSSGTWSCDNSAICGCYEGDKVTVYYLAGTEDVPGWELAVMQLAHARMGEQPCGCALQERQWRRDREIPSILTAEQLLCPFGSELGAWAAWRWVGRSRYGKAFML